MKLFNILNDKGRDVVALQTSMSLQEAARILDSKRIGAAVALDSRGKLAGMLSERDIVRLIAEQGADAIELKVADVMTRDVITAPPEASIEEGLEKMTGRRIRHLPVVDGAELVGIVSIGDLVKQKISVAEAEAEAMKQYIVAG